VNELQPEPSTPPVATTTPAEEPGWGGVRLAVALLSAVVILAAVGLFVRNAANDLPWVNHDVAYLSLAASEILGGDRLYVDFDEVNPPGVFFLLAGQLAVARAIGLPDILPGHLFVLALGACGLIVLWRSLRRPDDDLSFVLVALAYLLVLVRGNFANNVVPAESGIPYDFGQREHLFAVVFLPYLVWRLRSARASVWGYLGLMMLGYVASFKPYWAVMVGAVELWRLFRDDRRAPGVYVALLVGWGLPFLILLVHSPAAFAAFAWDVLPQMVGGIYAYYELTPAQFAITGFHLRMMLGGAVFGALWLRCFSDRLVERSALGLLLIVEAIAYGSFVHQGKFWSYHAMVFFGTTVVSAAVLAAAVANGPLRRWGRTAIAVVGSVLLAVAVGGSLVQLHRMLDLHLPKGAALVPLLRGERNVMVLSTAGDYAYAPLVLGLRTVGPWGEHYRVAPLLTLQDPKRRRAEVEDYAAKIARRIAADTPEVLVFAPYRHGLPPGDSLHDILVSHGALPDGIYRRLPQALLEDRHPALAGWIVYTRIESSDPGRKHQEGV